MRMTHYGFRPTRAGRDSGAGGNGVIREYTLDAEEAELFLWFERSQTPAWGLFGGRDATPPDVVLNPGREDERQMLKAAGVTAAARRRRAHDDRRRWRLRRSGEAGPRGGAG